MFTDVEEHSEALNAKGPKKMERENTMPQMQYKGSIYFTNTKYSIHKEERK